MTFERFKELHHHYSTSEHQDWNIEEREDYVEAMYENEQYHHWALQTDLEEAGFDHSGFCCVVMANHVFNSFDEEGNIKVDDADVIINQWSDGTFGIPIHDGGPSVVKIKFCPWCGTKLN